MRKENLLIIILVILGFLLRLVNLNQSFWLDEAAQISESSKSFLALFDQSIVPHPPLFRIFMHFWLYGGRSETFLRLPSVLFGVGSIILTYLLGKRISAQWKLNKRQTEILSYGGAFFLAINQYHIYYSQELRPYSLTCFMGLLSTFFLFSQRWRWYIIVSMFFLYTTYFAWFLFLAHLIYVYSLKRGLLKKTLFSLLISSSVFAFYLPFFIKQTKVLGIGMVKEVPGWAEAVSVPLFKVLPLIFIKFTLGRISYENKLIYGLLGIILFSFYSIAFLRSYLANRRLFFTLFILIAVPVATSFIVSIVIPVIAPQRLIFCLAFLLLLFCLGLSFSTVKMKIFLLILALIIDFNSLFLYYTNPKFQREQWREAVKFLEENGNQNSIALFVFPRPFAPWSYYQTGRIEGLGVTKKVVLKDEDLNDLELKLTNKKTIYLFQYLTGLTDPQEKTRHFLPSLGFREVSIKDFPGVGFIYVYEKI